MAYCSSDSSVPSASGQCSGRSYSSSAKSVIVTAPAAPPVPLLTMSTSARIGPCDDMYLDASASQGDAGRAWQSMAWTVAGNNAKNITNYLNSHCNDTNIVAVVPNRLLRPGSFTVTLVAQNIFGVSGLVTRNIEVSSAAGAAVFPDKIPNLHSLSLFLDAFIRYTSCEHPVQSQAVYQ